MMKAMTIASAVSDGIPLTPAGEIEVGEDGRGRECVRVPLPEGAVVDNRTLVSVPGEGGVVLLIRDQSGFRGTWSLSGGSQTAQAAVCAARDALRVARDVREAGGDYSPSCPAGRAVSEAEEALRRAQEARGSVPLPEGVWVIARGHRAQGDAGRMGGGPEYLIRVPFGAQLLIRRRGRLYGKPAILRLEVGEAGALRAIDVSAEDATRAAALAW